MRKLAPYLISYLIIATGTAVFLYLFRQTGDSSLYVLHTTLSHDDLVAKLQQAGIPGSALTSATRTPAPLATVVSIFACYGVGFGVFVGLALLIERLIFKPRP